MSGEESGSYAPKSPDLSSFFSAGPTQQPAPPHLSLENSSSSYRPPTSAHRQQQPPSQHYHPPQPQRGTSNTYQPPTFNYSSSSSYVPPGPAIKSEYPPYTAPPAPAPAPTQQQPYLPPSPHQPTTPQSPYTQQAPGFPSVPHGQPYPYAEQAQHPPAPGLPGAAYAPVHSQGQPSLTPHQQESEFDMPGRRAAAAVPQEPPAPAFEPSSVRTKFPTARIKRIMQADEEVGKVAQQTPIAVGKALELFMVQLVTKSAEVAKDKSSKRVTAPMLKQVVENDEQWDFLTEIVSKVENEKEGNKAKPKAESESDDETFEPKKRGRGGRKKKAA